MGAYSTEINGEQFVIGRAGPGHDNMLEQTSLNLTFYMTNVDFVMTVGETVERWFGPGMLELEPRRLQNMRRVSLVRTLYGVDDRQKPAIEFRLSTVYDPIGSGFRIRHVSGGVEVYMPLKFFAGQAISHLSGTPDLPLGEDGLGPGVADRIRTSWETVFGKVGEPA